MPKLTHHCSTLTEARADYLWCVRARLIERSENGWGEFLAGYLSMEELGAMKRRGFEPDAAGAIQPRNRRKEMRSVDFLTAVMMRRFSQPEPINL
mgnify:CR=1 FL=1